MCVIATALLWYATPELSSVLWALIFVAVASAAFEFTMVFYNAMLPEIAPKGHVGRLSGLGWGLGYVGGLAALALCLVGFVETDTPWFGLSTDAAENIRAIFGDSLATTLPKTGCLRRSCWSRVLRSLRS